MTPNLALISVLLIPWLGLFFVAISARRPNVREFFSLTTALALFASVTALLINWNNGLKPDTLDLTSFAPGINISFTLEPLGMLFCLVASFLWIVNTLYSISYMRKNAEQHQTRFYLCFIVAIASTMGLALSANLFTLFIFYEILTLSTYPLVTHKGNDAAKKGGRVYLGYLLGSSIVFLLFAIIWTWHLTGTLDFKAGGLFNQSADPITLSVLLCLYIFGIGKAAIMPLHRWLPAAMVAPTPVSALLHAVAVVKAGVFTVLKVVLYIFGPTTLARVPATEWLLYLAGFTIILASIFALQQDNLKKRLAYSTVSQLSYVIMASLLLHPLALLAAALHIAIHAFGKITLFFTAGSIYTASHKTNISQLNGIGRAMPWTMTAFTIAALSMVGLPPTAGFVSKWYLLTGGMSLQHWFVISVLVISTLLNAAYFLPISYAAFLKKPDSDLSEQREAPLLMVSAIMIVATGTIALFFFSSPLIALLSTMFPDHALLTTPELNSGLTPALTPGSKP